MHFSLFKIILNINLAYLYNSSLILWCLLSCARGASKRRTVRIVRESETMYDAGGKRRGSGRVGTDLAENTNLSSA
jgi:hypothetical protein